MPRIPLPTPETMTPNSAASTTPSCPGRAVPCAGPCLPRCIARNWPTNGNSLASCCAIAPRCRRGLSELAILVTARHCRCALEWHIHEDMAVKAKLERAIIEDIRAGRRPVSADAGALAIYDYAEELTRRTHVRSEVYQRVLDRWQPVGVVELTALIGYYTMVAMTLNAHEFPLPDGAPPPFEPAPAGA